MIILHKKTSNSDTVFVEEKLNELVVSYKTVNHSTEENTELPYIEESGKIYKSKQEIDDWLQELEDELQKQRSISGDGCYIDPNNGKIY